MKISEQVHISTVIEKLFSVVDPVHVGAAKRASQLHPRWESACC